MKGVVINKVSLFSPALLITIGAVQARKILTVQGNMLITENFQFNKASINAANTGEINDPYG